MRRTSTILAVAALALVGVGAGTVSAQAVPEGVVLNAGAPDTVPGLYIVGLHGGLKAARATVTAEAESLVDQYGGDIRHVYSAALRGFSVHLSEKDAARLAAAPGVEFVQQSLWVHSADVAGEQPNPPSWGLDQIDGANDGKYTYPNTGTGATVYNTDTELNLDHVSFEGRAESGYDFVDDDDNVNDCKGPADQGHGTHTGGTSSSEAYGVAKDVTIVGVKVLDCTGNAPDADSIQGIDWVTQNARKPAVANASWTSGGAGADPEGINRAIRNSSASGVTWVAAAGNENQDACNVSPAKVPEVITVAATQGENNAEASYSNHGSCVDIYAPGSNITSASNSNNTGSKNLQGTSMAAPHVTGAAALYLSSNPSATAAQVQAAIVDSAATGVVVSPGPGSPNRFLDVSDLGGGQPGGPLASFTADCANTLDCSFDGTASTGAESYAWTFGDGATGDAATEKHTYASAGEYRVTLTVTDGEGKESAPVTKTVRAGPHRPAGRRGRRSRCSASGRRARSTARRRPTRTTTSRRTPGSSVTAGRARVRRRRTPIPTRRPTTPRS